jgi:antitoxin (DNA-binding transcriptional repressor) of toxin-antitoxin stability system
MKASIRDLRTRTVELVRHAENGEVIVIERRGKPVTELRPLQGRRKRIELPDMTRFWNEFPQLTGDSTGFFSNGRDR